MILVGCTRQRKEGGGKSKAVIRVPRGGRSRGLALTSDLADVAREEGKKGGGKCLFSPKSAIELALQFLEEGKKEETSSRNYWPPAEVFLQWPRRGEGRGGEDRSKTQGGSLVFASSGRKREEAACA